MWINYPFLLGNDTPTYIHLANNLRNNLGFAKYNGTRTPGYPFFILLTGSNANLYLLQLALGLVTSLLIYLLLLKLTKQHTLALLGSAAHSLNLGQLFYEGAMLSEALSAFFLFACVWLFYKLLNESLSNKRTLYALIIGVLSLIMATIRPLFLIFPFTAALFTLRWDSKPSFFRSLVQAIILGLPTALGLVVWVAFIYTRFNVLGLDAIGGYHVVNLTSSFFELAPEKYAVITEVFLKYREIKVAQTGTPINTIWDAIPELMTVTKLNYYALGREMGAVSSELIRQNSGLYVNNLVKGWLWFWKVGVLWDPSSISAPIARRALPIIMTIERMVLIALNGVFLIGSAAHVMPKIRKFLQPTNFTYFLIAFIWFTSILQTFAEHGDNPRFLAPAQSLIVVILLIWVYRLVEWRKNEKRS